LIIISTNQTCPRKAKKFILLKSDGTGLYSTKDIALAKKKFEEYKIDKSIYVVDYAQTLHFKQVFATLAKLGFKQSEKCYHLRYFFTHCNSYGQVVLPTGKMSSRKGTVVFFSYLKKQLEESILKEFFSEEKEKEKEGLKKKNVLVYSEEEKKHIVHFLSVATIKYGMLNQDPSSNIIFNIKTWTAKTGIFTS
jgi:arginyl-tRNA synthetase